MREKTNTVGVNYYYPATADLRSLSLEFLNGRGEVVATCPDFRCDWTELAVHMARWSESYAEGNGGVRILSDVPYFQRSQFRNPWVMMDLRRYVEAQAEAIPVVNTYFGG